MEAVGRLAGGVAHDLNNVLTVIQSFGELAQDDLEPRSQTYEYLEQVLAASERARLLTRQLLAFSRRQAQDLRVVTFNEVAMQTHKMLRRVIGEDVEVVVQLPEVPWPVKIDPSHFEQVLLNLAVNARDAMPKGGTLLIEVENVELDASYADAHGVELPAGDYSMLAVSDTGVGIPADVQEQIFEPFFTTKEKGKGTGLGLSTCYGIVKQAMGFIWVYSEVAVGSTFKIYVPRTHERGTAVVPPRKIVRDLGGSEQLLVVEDDESVRALLVGSLRELGYQVVAAHNGLEALELVRSGRVNVDLVVTDVVMPRMGGPELAERLQADGVRLKVLFMSGYTDDALSRHGLLHDSVMLLEKPFTPRRLAEKIREVLDGS